MSRPGDLNAIGSLTCCGEGNVLQFRMDISNDSSLEAMPLVLRWISYVIPLRYYLVVIRALLLKGVGAAAIQNEIIALAIFGVAIMGAAAMRFRKRLD